MSTARASGSSKSKKTRPCKSGKIKVNGRCVKKCGANQTRKAVDRKGTKRCVTTSKAGYIFNKLSGRLVKEDGPTGKWIRGAKHPSKKNGKSYVESCHSKGL